MGRAGRHRTLEHLDADVAFLTLNDELTAGTQFVWKEKGTQVTSRLGSVLPNRPLNWTGKAMGMFATHIFTLAAQKAGVRW